MDGKQIGSENLAVLIVDALVDARIVAQTEFEKGVLVSTESINSRKALGDYYDEQRLPSESLGMVIVNKLIQEGVVEQTAFQKAVEIATEEIDVRKALGDYIKDIK
jgi:hypothetical protein